MSEIKVQMDTLEAHIATAYPHMAANKDALGHQKAPKRRLNNGLEQDPTTFRWATRFQDAQILNFIPQIAHFSVEIAYVQGVRDLLFDSGGMIVLPGR